MTSFASSGNAFFRVMSFNFCRSYEQTCFFSDFRLKKYLWCYSGYVFDGFSCDMYSFFRCFPRKSQRRATFGSTKRNITTIEVALTGRSWKKFSFLDALSVKLAFRATYRNYSPNFVRENGICVGVQTDHTEQHSSSENSAIEKNFWSLIGLGCFFLIEFRSYKWLKWNKFHYC